MNCPIPPRPAYRVPTAHGGCLVLGERTLVMGILNVTPDSFGSTRLQDPALALDVALQMEQEGADLLDIGGESTRPGADPVTLEDERARVLPVVRALAGRLRIPMSVDTYKAEVARQAIAEGAAIINDVSGLQYDVSLAGVVADSGAALVLMHTRGRPKDMYAQAAYADVVADVIDELKAAVRRAEAGGVTREQLIVDPGIGFAKRPEHSYGVLARIADIGAALERPVLVGPSRKSFMSVALNNRRAEDRDWGTAAAVASATLSGAHIVRVHAVGPMAQVVRVAEEIRNA